MLRYIQNKLFHVFDHVAVCSETPSNVFAPSTHTLCVSYSPTTHNTECTNTIISFPQYFSIIIILLPRRLLLLTLILISSSSLYFSSSYLHSRNICCNAFRCLDVLPVWRVQTYSCEAQSHLCPDSHLYGESWDFRTAGFVNIMLFRGANQYRVRTVSWLLWPTTWGELFLWWRHKYPAFVTILAILWTGGRRKGDCGW